MARPVRIHIPGCDLGGRDAQTIDFSDNAKLKDLSANLSSWSRALGSCYLPPP